MRVPHSALRDEITIEDLAGEGAYGSTFGSAREGVRASVQETQTLVYDERGVQVMVDTRIIIRPEAGPVRAGSRLTIGADKYRVVKSFPIPDSHSPSHYELLVRVWGVVT